MDFTKPLVKNLLENAQQFTGWSLQGFGMLRLYLNSETRLHIWDNRYQVPGVSLLHTHPWDFTSRIVVGKVTNVRYERHGEGQPFWEQLIRCGAGGGLCDLPIAAALMARAPEVYTAGQIYHQRAREIHETSYEDGTVTIIARAFKEDPDHARVFWPLGENWGSAEPRPATPREVEDIVSRSLERWF